jgi:hypothetical protein
MLIFFTWSPTFSRGHHQWHVVDGLIIVGGHVFILMDSQSLQPVLANAHGTDHEGIEKTVH